MCLLLLLLLLLLLQTSFKAYMRQLGQQYGGKGLVGSKLWLLRCDQHAAAAAGDVQLGVELWMPAEVTAFHDCSGEHEVRQR
jgi:hypothetical protein